MKKKTIIIFTLIAGLGVAAYFLPVGHVKLAGQKREAPPPCPPFCTEKQDGPLMNDVLSKVHE